MFSLCLIIYFYYLIMFNFNHSPYWLVYQLNQGKGHFLIIHSNRNQVDQIHFPTIAC